MQAFLFYGDDECTGLVTISVEEVTIGLLYKKFTYKIVPIKLLFIFTF